MAAGPTYLTGAAGSFVESVGDYQVIYALGLVAADAAVDASASTLGLAMGGGVYRSSPSIPPSDDRPLRED